MEATEEGRYEIDEGNLKAIIYNKSGMSVAVSVDKFECHDKHINIQLCIKGTEQIGWKHEKIAFSKKENSILEKDVVF